MAFCCALAGHQGRLESEGDDFTQGVDFFLDLLDAGSGDVAESGRDLGSMRTSSALVDFG